MDEYETNTSLSELLEKYELQHVHVFDSVYKNKQYSVKDFIEYFSDTVINITTYIPWNNGDDLIKSFAGKSGGKSFPCLYIVFKHTEQEVVPKLDEEGNVMFENLENMLIPMTETIENISFYDYYTDDLSMVKQTKILNILKNKD